MGLDYSSHLFSLLSVILAADFDILLGKITIKVPLVVEGDDYSLVCEYLTLMISIA